MKQKPFTLLLIPLILFAACSSLQPELGLATTYFPGDTYLRDGIVNKYYIHTTSNSDADVSTKIQYRYYQLTKPDELTVKGYNPAMELTWTTRFQFEVNKMNLLERTEIVRGDTLSTHIIDPNFIDWEGQHADYAYRRTYPSGQEIEYNQQQLTRIDSTIEYRKAKIFHQKGTQQSIYKGDSVTYELNFITTYMKGIGLYAYELDYGSGSSRLELIEQIPYKKFQEMANHGVKRIGYIDPRIVLDQDSGFELCGKHDDVADYYNGQDKMAQYNGGKKAIWELVNKQLNKAELFNESGYLTLRFIVNCEGEAGWFTLEEADLDFQPKRFPSETIQHFYEILYQHPDWKPCIIREEARDAYTYITFKLKDGEIIEILP